MANINLLPWRETRRQERKKQFLTGLGVTLAAAALSVFLWDLVVNSQIDYQKSRNQHLRTHIALLDQEVAEIRDLQRKLAVELARVGREVLRLVEELPTPRAPAHALLARGLRRGCRAQEHRDERHPHDP